MTTVTVSPRFNITIPKLIRDNYKIKSGQKFEMVQYEDRLELVPVNPIETMRGFLKGIDTTVIRGEDRI